MRRIMIGQFILALTMILVLSNASEAKERRAEVV